MISYSVKLAINKVLVLCALTVLKPRALQDAPAPAFIIQDTQVTFQGGIVAQRKMNGNKLKQKILILYVLLKF